MSVFANESWMRELLHAAKDARVPDVVAQPGGEWRLDNRYDGRVWRWHPQVAA